MRPLISGIAIDYQFVISVLPVVSRLFEKLIYDQLYTYLSNKDLLFTGQSESPLFHSVLTSLLKCSNEWYLNLGKGQYTSVTFIDLKKAFEAKQIGWFLSYLDNRKQCCKVKGHI